MSHSQSDPTSQIRFSICKIEPTSTVPKSESLPTESTPFTNKSQSVKKQKIRFDDSSIKSPSKKSKKKVLINVIKPIDANMVNKVILV